MGGGGRGGLPIFPITLSLVVMSETGYFIDANKTDIRSIDKSGMVPQTGLMKSRCQAPFLSINIFSHADCLAVFVEEFVVWEEAIFFVEGKHALIVLYISVNG